MTEKRKTLPSGLTGNTLKLIAIFTMLIDHIGAAVIEAGILSSNDMARMMAILETERGMQWYLADIVLRLIGRLAFPIFCFLLVEGFTHTGNEAKYARNLLLFALISEIPFALAFFGRLFFPGAQNVYFTLFLGVEMMCFLKKYAGRPVIQGAAVAAACGLSVLLKSDYSYMGILMIASFYLLRNRRTTQLILAGILAAAESLTLFGAAALALIPIARYNGERGKLRLKYFFYWFYPVHIMALYLLRCLLFGQV